MATFDEMQKAYTAQTDRTAAINQQYDAQKEMQLNNLKQAYDQQVSAQQAAQQKIDPAYQQKANDLAIQYERNRRNFNQQAAGNGINTGTGSQAQLAMMSAYQRDYGALRTAQADAQAEAARGMADLEVNYQNQIQAALAQSDYERATALMSEYKDRYNRDLAQAQTLAKYGDFSLYSNLYGADAANNMASTWNAQNPDLAYNTGRITAEDYFRMTGKYPKGSPEAAAAAAASAGTVTGNVDTTKFSDEDVTKMINSGLYKRDPKTGGVYLDITDEQLAKMSDAQLKRIVAAAEAQEGTKTKLEMTTGGGRTTRVRETK